MENKLITSDHFCKGHMVSSWSDPPEFDCGYNVPFPCDECVFVVGENSNDYRKGKRPWAKKWQDDEE